MRKRKRSFASGSPPTPPPPPESLLETLLAQATTVEEVAAIERALAEVAPAAGDQRLPETRAGPAAPASSAAGWIVSRLQDVARFFQVEYQTVKEWRTGPDPMPGTADKQGCGRFDLSEIAVWRINKAKQAAQAQVRSPKTLLDEQLTAVQLEQEKLKLAKQQGQLVRRDSVMAEARAIMARLAGRLDQLPDELAALIPDAELRAEIVVALRQGIDNMRRDVARWAAAPLPEEDQENV